MFIYQNRSIQDMAFIPQLVSAGLPYTRVVLETLQSHPLGIMAIFTVGQIAFNELKVRGYDFVKDNTRVFLFSLGIAIIGAPFIIEWSLSTYEWFKDTVGDISDDFFQYTGLMG